MKRLKDNLLLPILHQQLRHYGNHSCVRLNIDFE